MQLDALEHELLKKRTELKNEYDKISSTEEEIVKYKTEFKKLLNTEISEVNFPLMLYFSANFLTAIFPQKL